MRNRSGHSPAAFLLPLYFGLFLLTTFVFGPVLAATTDTVAFQSKLVNADGTNIPDNTYNFRFRMFTVSSGGTVEWSEDRSLSVVDGVLSADLGAVTPFGSSLFDNPSLYLQICFDGNGADADSSDANCGSGTHRYEEVFTTRKPITAVPVAFRAKYLTDGAGNAFGPNDFFKQGGNAFGAAGVLGTTDNNELQFYTNNTQKMVLTTDGRLGIGTTTPETFAPSGWSDMHNTVAIQTSLTEMVENGYYVGVLDNVTVDPTANAITNGIVGNVNNVDIASGNSMSIGYVSGSNTYITNYGEGSAMYAVGGDFGVSNSSTGTINTGIGVRSNVYNANDSSGILSNIYRDAVTLSGTTNAFEGYVYNSSVTTSGTDLTFGSNLSVSRTLATGGTIETYGQYISLQTDNAGSGTHTATGLYVELDGNADYNYAAIFQGGNVGIGTGTPTEKLTVNGNILTQYTPTDVSTITLQGTSIGFVQPLKIVTSGNYSYIISSAYKLYIFDISNPAHQVLMSETTLLEYPHDIAKSGNYVYIVNNYAKLAIYDVTDPTSVVAKGSTSTNLAYPYAVKVSGNYAYVVDPSTQKLAIFDISNPDVIVAKGTISTNINWPTSLDVSGNYVYIIDVGYNTLAIYDVTDKDAIVAKGTIATGINSPVSVSVAGSYAYLTNQYTNTLSVFDISNPDSIVAKGTTTTNLNGPQSVLVSGNYAYINNANTTSLAIFDVSDPDNLVAKGTVIVSSNQGARGIALSGTHVFVPSSNLGSVSAVDVSNPLVPVISGQYGAINSPYEVAVTGNYSVVADGANGLLVYNTSNPSTPFLAGSRLEGVEGPGGLAVVGNYVYATSGSNNWLAIFDITDPENIVAHGTTSTNISSPADVAVSGAYAYVVSCSNNALSIFDISNPDSIVAHGTTSTNMICPWKVSVSGNYAYVLDDYGVISIFDITDPDNIVASGVKTGLSSPNDVAGAGNYAYVVTNDAKLIVLDATNPNAMVTVGEVTLPYYGDSIKVVGGYAYIAMSNYIGIYDISSPEHVIRKSILSTTTNCNNLLDVSGANVHVIDACAGKLSVYEAAFTPSNVSAALLLGNDITAYGTDGADTSNVGEGKIYFDATENVFKISEGGSAYTRLSGMWNDDGNQNIFSQLQGNVGIGTSTPTEKLSVNGNVLISQGTKNTVTITPKSSVGLPMLQPVDVAVVGNYSYVIDQGTNTLQIYDISDASHIVAKDTTTENLDYPVAIRVVGNYAYVVNYNPHTLTIYDISDPANIVAHGAISSGLQYPNSLYVAGNYAYVTDGGTNTVQIYDISNPDSITSAGATAASTTGPTSVYVVGSYAYVLNSSSGTFTIYDVSNPGSIVEKDTESGIYSTNNVVVSGSYAYVTATDKVAIYDVSNVNAIVAKGTTTTNISTARRGALQSNYLYVVDEQTSKLMIYDVTDPDSIVAKDTETLRLGEPRTLAVSGNYAYVVNPGGSTMSTYDISNPNAIIVKDVVGSLRNSQQGLEVAGMYAYAIDDSTEQLHSYDISDITNIRYLDSIDDGLTSPSGISVLGNHVYVSDCNSSSLIIYDVTDRTHMLKKDSISTGLDCAGDVIVSGSYAYVASSNNSVLAIFDISDPDNIVAKDTILEVGFFPWRLALAGSYLYATDGTSIRSYDISNVNNIVPKARSASSIASSLTSMAISGDYLYGTDFSNRKVLSFDISNHNEIKYLSFVDGFPYYPYDIKVSGSYAYTVDYNDSLYVIDIENPYHMVLKANNNTGIPCSASLATTGNEVYVVDNCNRSVSVFQITVGTSEPPPSLALGNGITAYATESPGISGTNQGKIYFDSATNTFRVSENGGAFVDLVGGGGSQWTTTGSDIYYANSVGIGTTTPSTAQPSDWGAPFSNVLAVQKTLTDLVTPSVVTGLMNNLVLNPSANATSYVTGIMNEVEIAAGNGSTLNTVVGTTSYVGHTGLNIVNTGVGGDFASYVNGTGKFENAYGIKAAASGGINNYGGYFSATKNTVTDVGITYGTYTNVNNTSATIAGTDITYGSSINVLRSSSVGSDAFTYGERISVSADDAGTGYSLATGLQITMSGTPDYAQAVMLSLIGASDGIVIGESGTTYNNTIGISHSTSDKTGDLINANMAWGSGSFTGDFLDLNVNNVNKFKVDNAGNTIAAGQVVVGNYAINPTGLAAGAMIFNTTSGVFQCFGGVVWSNCGANALITGADAALADGSYINIAHGLNTNDLLTTGWVYSDSVWKQLDGSYTPAIAWEGKETARETYYQAANLYASTSETDLYTKNILSQGLFFDTFEDKTKVDSANTTATYSTGILDPGFASSIYSNRKGQKGRVGLWGNQVLSAGTADTEGKTYLGTSTVKDTFLYERTKDSIPQVLVELGVDPNWYNGVSLVSAQGQSANIVKQSKNLTLTYNGSLIKATGRYASNARPIQITIKSPTTFDWTDNNGNSATGVTATFGVAQALGSTGVSVTFTNASYNVGDVFQIASWFTEPVNAVRGSKQEFPERAYIVGSDDAVNIIDADTQKMWMWISQGANYAIGPTSGVMGAVEFLNGKLYEGNSNDYNGLVSFDFALDQIYKTDLTDYRVSNMSISSRNAANTFSFVSTQRKLPSPYSTVGDISVKVIPNQPTQEVTVSGWGYIVGTGVLSQTETINLPYVFNNNPTVVVAAAGYYPTPSALPPSLATCTGASATVPGNVSTISTKSITVGLTNPGSTLTTNYAFCYTWTATGIVSPQQIVAVAAGSGATLISETYGTSSQISNAASANIALSSNGAVYYDYIIPPATPYYQVFGYHLAANPVASALSYNDWYGDRYHVAYAVTHLVGSTSYPTSITVADGASTLSTGANSIYITSDAGVNAIQEFWDGSYGEGYARNVSEVKYYTKDYITESIYGQFNGMWPLNGSGNIANATTINDSSYQPYNATASNANGTGMAYSSGVRGTGITFDGTDDYLDLGVYSRYHDGTSKMISVWVKPNASGPTVANVYDGKGIVAAGNANWGIIQSNYGGNDRIYAYNYDGNQDVVGATYTVGEWAHFVMVHTGGVLYMYKNGVLVGSTASGASSTLSGNIFVARGYTTGSTYFNGIIDEPFVGYVPRSAAQIKTMYENGLRALKSHGTGLGGAAADANQKLGGTISSASEVAVDDQGQYLYVATTGSSNGAVSKIQLNSDTNIKTYTSSANVPSGGALLTSNNVTTVEAGSDLELTSSSSGAMLMGPDNNATSNTGNYVSKTYTLPKSIASAVIWVNSQLDSSDAGNTVVVKASVDGGSNYATCTLVSTDSAKTPTEKEYACTFAASGSNLKIKFEFARTDAKTATYITQYGVTWLGQTGFRIEQVDANNIRLYNYTGESQNVKLDVTGSGAAGGGGGGDPLWVDGGTYLYTVGRESMRIYDGDGSNYFEIAHDGTNVNFIQDGSTRAYFDASGRFLPGLDDTYALGNDDNRWKDLFLGGDSLHIGTSMMDEGMISYNTSTNVLGISTDSTTNGDIAFFTDDLYLDKSSGNVGINTITPGRTLDIGGSLTATAPKAGYLSTDNMLLSSLDGGAYFGRTAVTENQWALNNVSQQWVKKESARAWRDIAVSSDGRIQTAVVYGGYIWISTDFGETWGQKATSKNWTSIAMSADGKVQTATVFNGFIWVSTDYGENWVQQGTSQSWASVAMSADGKYQAAVKAGENIYESSDFGTTWVPKTIVNTLMDVAMSSDGKIQTTVSTDGYRWTSSNYGESWTQIGGFGQWVTIAMSADGKYQLISLDTPGLLYRSTDYGVNWSTTGASHYYRGVAMSANGKYQIALDYDYGDSGYIYSSSDYGANWAVTSSELLLWKSAALSSDGRVQAAVTSNSYIYESIAGSYTNASVGVGGAAADWAKLNVSSTYSGGNAGLENAGIFNSYINTNVLTTGDDLNIGSYTSVQRYGATGGILDTYGEKIEVYADDAGAGTHTATGLYVLMSGNPDYSYAALFNGGNVGIGTYTPNNFALQVAGHIGPDENNTFDLGSSAYRFRDLYLGESSLHIGTSTTDEGTISYDTTNNVLGINTDSTTNADIALLTDVLYLDKSTGNVGVGMTTPTAKLEVASITGPVVVAATIKGDPGTSSVFASYNFRAQEVATPSWTLVKNDSTGNYMRTFAFDPVNNVMYAGVGDWDGFIYRCETSTGCDSNGEWTISYDSDASDNVIDVKYNPNHGGELYTVDENKIYKCSITATSCDAPTDWVLAYTDARGYIASLEIDSANDVLYFTANFSGGAIGRCDISSTSCDAQGDFADVNNTGSEIEALQLDAVHGTLYVTKYGGNLYRCPTSSGCDASGDFTVVANLSAGNDEAGHMAIDTANNIFYVPIGDTVWRCDLSTNCDAQGDWATTFDANEQVGWSNMPVIYDSVHSKIYVGSSGSGLIYQCSTSTNCDEPADWSISFDSTQEGFVGLGYDPVHGVVYGGTGVDGYIYRYDAGAPLPYIDYASIAAQSTDTTSGQEDGRLIFKTLVNGTLTDTVNIGAGNVGIGSIPQDDVKLAVSSTITGGTVGGEKYGMDIEVSNDNVISSGSDYTLGSYLSVTRNSAIGGTIDTYGQIINVNTDNAGTGVSTAYGLVVSLNGGADNNYAGIFTGGNVGIGTSTPTVALDVQGIMTEGVLGSEMITSAFDREFTDDIGHWTGTNWLVAGGVATLSSGANALTLNNTALTAAPVAGKIYQVTYTVWTTTPGLITVSFGGTAATVQISTGAVSQTQTQSITATNADPLTFTPDGTWIGAIDDVSIVETTASYAIQNMRNSDGTIGAEFRTGGTGSLSLYLGTSAGQLASTGNRNVGIGTMSLMNDSSGARNTAVGYASMKYNTTGEGNTALGSSSLTRNTTGRENVGVGYTALMSNSSGAWNSAFGTGALRYNTDGRENTAIGFLAMNTNTDGDYSAALGAYALYNATGSNNIAIGWSAGDNITTGSSNIIIGYDIDAPLVAGSNQLNIGNFIFGTGFDGTGTTLSAGKVGIGLTTPVTTLDLNGTFRLNNNMYLNGGYASLANTGTVLTANKVTTINTAESWTSGTAGGTARYNQSSVLYNNKIYTWGGRNGSDTALNTIDIYDFLTGQWITGLAGGTARSEQTGTLYNGKIYFWGGMNQAGTALNTMDIYDIATNTWTTGATGGTARRIHMSVLYNGKIYSWGGYASGYLDSVDIYDIANNSWSTGTSSVAGTGRYSGSAFTYNGKIYFWGGYRDVARNYMDIYDPVANSWSSGVAGGTARYNNTFALYNGRMYVFGGQDAANVVLNTVEYYDFATGTWSSGVSGGVARFHQTGVVYDGKAYSIAGKNSSDAPINSVDIYNFNDNQHVFAVQEDGIDSINFNTGSIIKTNTGKLSLMGGNIGIGTSTPAATLDVAGYTNLLLAKGIKQLSGTIDPTASTTVTGVNTAFLSEVTPGDQLILDGTAVITGSINPTASTAVAGVGTLFTTELKVGDQITVNGETRTVVAITSTTALTVGVAFTDTANDTAVDRISTETRSVVSVASNTSLTVDRAFVDNSNDVTPIIYLDALDVTGTTQFLGGAQFLGLGTPNAPTVTPQGATSSITWGYKISAVNALGNETVLSAAGTTTTGNGTLTTSNFNRISWSAVPGASAYRIYRTQIWNSVPMGLVGEVSAGSTLQFDDVGNGVWAGYSGSPFDETSNVGIGTQRTPPRDTLTVDGRINQTWHYVFEDFFGGRANITANAVLNAGSAFGFAIIGTTGCTGSYPNVVNGVFRMTTGIVSGNGCQLNFGTAGLPTVKQYDVSYNPVMEVAINPGTTTNKRILVGLTDTTTATAAEPANGVYFFCTTNGTAAYVWVATTARASAYVRTDTGVLCTLNAMQTLRIEATASSAKFYINNVLVATPVSTTSGTNLPAAGSTLGPLVSNWNTSTVAITADVDSVEIWQDDPDTTGMPGALGDSFALSPIVNNPKLYTDTTYAKGASQTDIPYGLAVSYSSTQEFDDQATNKLVYDVATSKSTDKTVLGIGAGLVDPSNVFDASLNPYAVAVSGPTYAWVEEGDGTNIELGDELSLSTNEDGYLASSGTQKLAHALEAVDWSTVTETLESGKKKKLVKVYVTEGSLPGTVTASFGSGVGANPWSTVDDTTIQTPYKVIASSMLATTGDFNVLKARTLNVNNTFMVDDSGNVTAMGSVFATAVSTPTIKGVAGGLSIEVLSDESFKLKVGGETAIEASVKGVKINNLIVSDKQAGKVTIPAGQTQVTVSTNLVTNDSIVVVTPNKAVTTAVQTNNGTFVIKLSSSQSQDIEIGWYIVNVEQ